MLLHLLLSNSCEALCSQCTWALTSLLLHERQALLQDAIHALSSGSYCRVKGGVEQATRHRPANMIEVILIMFKKLLMRNKRLHRINSILGLRLHGQL